jgi:thioredoxin-related protein
MKKVIYCFAFLLIFALTAYGETQNSKVNINNLPQAETTWHRGPGREWEVNFNDAITKAKEGKKKVFMLATGSDWCPPCKALKSNVLSHAKFQRVAGKNFVFLWLDFPRRARLPQDQIQHNYTVKQHFPFGNGVPSAVIIDPVSRKVLGKISGYKPLNGYLDELEKYSK